MLAGEVASMVTPVNAGFCRSSAASHRMMEGQPVRPGVYIRSGRKTVVGRIRSSAVLLQ